MLKRHSADVTFTIPGFCDIMTKEDTYIYVVVLCPSTMYMYLGYFAIGASSVHVSAPYACTYECEVLIRAPYNYWGEIQSPN